MAQRIQLNYISWKIKQSNESLPYKSWLKSGSRRLLAYSGSLEYYCKVSPDDELDYTTTLLSSEDKTLGNTTSVFAAKGNLYYDGEGKEFTISAPIQNLDFTIPNRITKGKFDGIEVIGGLIGDIADLQVLDTSTGYITTYPNFILNQFGTNWGIAKDFYKKQLPYEADIFTGLQIRLVYKSKVQSRNIIINYSIHRMA